MKSFIETMMISLLLTSILSYTVYSGDDIDRTKRPAGKPAPKISLPEIQKATLKNGLKIWLVERHQLPTVALNLVIQAGSDHDPINRPGIASMTADVLDEGTKTRDALQISDALESIGARFGILPNWDGTFMTLNIMTKYLETGLDIFADVLANPTFPQKEFERLQRQRMADLKRQRDQATMIADNAFSFVLYGVNHPYGNNQSGTEASLNSMTTDELVKFYQTYYRPNNATLIVVGDVKMDYIKSLLEKSLSEWKSSDVASFAVPEPEPVERVRVYLIDKPGAPQSEIRIGYPALSRSTPDYFPVIVMNRMLGGQFTSRINLNLREKHGFTYGARSGFSFQKGVGPFTASAGVYAGKTDSSIHEFLYEINLMHEKGMTAEELEFVKKGLIGNFALTFETSAQIAGALQNIILYGLPENYYQNYLQNIENVAIDDVQRVAKKYLSTSNMAIVVVGDLAKIKGGISAMRLGEVVLCDLDGKPLK